MNTRREFLKNLMAFSAASFALLLGKNAFAKPKKGEKQDPNTCDAKPGVEGAGQIGYIEDKSKVSAAAQTSAEKGKTVKFANQTCSNCIMFQGGVCTIITSGCKKVKPTAWCPTWTHNPAAKS